MIIFFDIGGTRMRVAGSKEGKEFSEPVINLTPQAFDEGIALFQKAVREVAVNEPISQMIGGVTGIFNEGHTALLSSPHLTSWIGKPLKEELEKFSGSTVLLKNDSALVGLGEGVYGAGVGGGIFVYITVSTGVGGARFIDNKIDHSKLGFEPGHQIISIQTTAKKFALFNFSDELNLENTKLVTLEDLISGSALEKKLGRVPREITDSNVWDQCAYMLAIGLHNTFLHWSPDRLVLGGAMFNDTGISIDKVKEYLVKIVRVPEEMPKILKGQLGDSGGLYGAMALYNQQ
jgi:glucokinase